MSRSIVSDDVADEAITWFARLRAEDVSERDRARFYAWLREGADRQQAFVEIVNLWEGLSVLRELELEELRPFPLVADFKRRAELAR